MWIGIKLGQKLEERGLSHGAAAFIRPSFFAMTGMIQSIQEGDCGEDVVFAAAADAKDDSRMSVALVGEELLRPLFPILLEKFEDAKLLAEEYLEKMKKAPQTFNKDADAPRPHLHL